MKNVIESIQTAIEEIALFKYVDEDWGQLDYYSPNFPVQWPCALIDVTGAQYSNLGKDRQQTPINRQQAQATATITVANMKLSNTSGRAPQLQKDNAWSIHNLIEDMHKELQGLHTADNAQALIRTSLNRVRRDDGIQEYRITYSFGMSDV